MLNKADFIEKLVRFEPDKIEESSGLNITKLHVNT
jgi:hypothetical protein